MASTDAHVDSTAAALERLTKAPAPLQQPAEPESIPADPPHRKPLDLSDNARVVFEKRYLRMDGEGKPVEDIHEALWRVARYVAGAEAQLAGGTPLASANTFYELLTTMSFVPNSPTFSGAGTALGQLAACFVLPLEDDMGRSSAGIFQTLRDAALVQQTGGGNGFAFTRLRPKKSVVQSSMGSASGPCGFLKVYDTAFGEIAQGGSRRGANMAVLKVTHPDVQEFVHCKSVEGAISNFNISVGITDEFMRAVDDDEEIALIAPHDGSERGRLNARELFSEIATKAHHNGEPGVLFLDAANRTNPVPHLYELEATNPCVTADTIVMTSDGPRRADSLVGVPFEAVVGGETHRSTEAGFFRTGHKDVYKMTLASGHSLSVTEDHEILVQKANGDKVFLPASEIGDEEVCLSASPVEWGERSPAHRGQGWLLGMLVGDGHFGVDGSVKIQAWGTSGKELIDYAITCIESLGGDPRYHKTRTGNYHAERDMYTTCSTRLGLLAAELGISEKKEFVNDALKLASSDVQAGFIAGMFDADGTIATNREKGASVRLASSTTEHLETVQAMLMNLGINSTIYFNRREAGARQLPDGKGGLKDYVCRADHELVISKNNIVAFAARIELHDPAKRDALDTLIGSYTRGPYTDKLLSKVQSFEKVGAADVFDCTIPGASRFSANGVVVHNCGEQWLGPYESCCLGSVNLARHVTPEGKVDWARLQQTVSSATRFLDDVVTANAFVPAVPQLKLAAERCRRIGLGIMGLADMMFRVGVRYGSPAGQEFGAQIMEFVRYHTMRTSIALATERGKFPAIRGSVYDFSDEDKAGAADAAAASAVTATSTRKSVSEQASAAMLSSPDVGHIPTSAAYSATGVRGRAWTRPTPLEPYTRDYSRPSLDWDTLERDLRAHGIRNAAQNTVAPTGTISTVAGCEGYGCEPVFALAYTRNVVDEGKTLQLQYTSPCFEAALRAAGLDDDAVDAASKAVAAAGTCAGADPAVVPPAVADVFVTSSDVSPEEHIRQQAALQRFVDNSISKTINMPNSATVDDVRRAYKLAWELGCKGLTVYRTGSRDVVVLETKSTADQKKQKKQGDGGEDKQEAEAEAEAEKPATAAAAAAAAAAAPAAAAADGTTRRALFAPVLLQEPPSPGSPLKKGRPRKLRGSTYRVETPLGVTYVTVNEEPHKPAQPFEVFLQASKAGSDTAAVTEAMGRLISNILRITSPIPARERLGEIVRQLRGIGGQRTMGLGPRQVRSLPDGIAQMLREYLEDSAADAATLATLGPAVIGQDAGAGAIPGSTDSSVDEAAAAAAAAVAKQRRYDDKSIGVDLCPSCGAASFVFSEGCKSCHSCGHAQC